MKEAFSNAVYHRAYDERESIEVRVENDRIEIVSFRRLNRFVTIEGMKSYRVSNHRYRNRRIGDSLKELHLTESRNTGFKKSSDVLEKMDHRSRNLKQTMQEAILLQDYLYMKNLQMFQIMIPK